MMLLKYHSLRKPVLFIFFASLFLGGNAQDTEPDSTNYTEQFQTHPDTLVSVEVPAQNGTENSSVESSRLYFLDRSLQVNGGGPDSIRGRKLPDSVLQRLRSDGDFWYVNYVFEKEKKQPARQSESFTQSTAFQTILWLVIIGGFAAFVVIYLANSNAGLFRKRGRPIATTEDQVVDTDNIFEINYQREIDKAIAGSNYRLAVRLMFLRMLKNLSDKKVIHYKQSRTNFDYLMELHSTKYYNDFFRLTRNFEYSWYGQFAIDPDKFTVIKRDFENFDRTLNHR